ncbi:MAG: polysaccharide deacetylase family protein [Rhodobacterales bacterium]|nr:polysaccharide deacetylase family protein [Rhodobacterales bacterium]
MTIQRTDPEIVRSPADMCWPDGRRIAVVFNIAYEMWTPGATSGVGPMGNVLAHGIFDPNADSYGRYNAAVGTQRLMRIMERHGISATVMTSGLVAEHDPDQLRAYAAAGHEIVGHGYAQNLLSPTLSPEEDDTLTRESTDLIAKATGRRPTGWISPRVTSGPDTQRRLAQHGYDWHGDVLDDDLPYLQRFAEGEIVAVPMTIDFNDLPHAMRFGRTPRQFVDMFFEAVDAIRAQPAETVILDIFAHGHCYGRPAAAWAIDEMARRCAEQSDLWITKRSAIAAHFRAAIVNRS